MAEWEGGPPISVLGEGFCVPYTMEMMVKKKIQGLSKAHFEAYDVSGNLLLQVDGKVWKMQKKRVMRDPAGLPLLTLRQKGLTWRSQWTAHAGESSEDNVLFRVEEPSSIHFKTKLDVFLPRDSSDNTKPTNSDFRVSGSFRSLSFKVYKANSVLAQVTHSYSWGSFCKGKESFKVRVHPEVDYSFIMALLVILDETDNP